MTNEWKRCIVVQVSPNRYIVAEPALQDWSYRYITKPVTYNLAHRICREMNEVDCISWSDEVLNNLIDQKEN